MKDFMLGMISCALLVAGFALIYTGLASCATGLPHRPPTGNHGQGMAPPITCPHQYREIVTADDGVSVFLYCWGKKVET